MALVANGAFTWTSQTTKTESPVIACTQLFLHAIKLIYGIIYLNKFNIEFNMKEISYHEKTDIFSILSISK